MGDGVVGWFCCAVFWGLRERWWGEEMLRMGGEGRRGDEMGGDRRRVYQQLHFDVPLRPRHTRWRVGGDVTSALEAPSRTVNIIDTTTSSSEHLLQIQFGSGKFRQSE